MSGELSTEHPHIVRNAAVCGGAPIVRNTRIAVRHIAVMWKEGDSVEDIARAYPHLQRSWIHDALSYFLDHQQEIDKEIQENQFEQVMSKNGAVADADGIVRFPKGKVADGQ